MFAPHTSNFIQIYERACVQIATDPRDRQAQHQAVLALARMGSTQFAKSEYERYGLSNVQDDEDIMCLDARLSKDLYLCASGENALKHAQDSARKYEAAYQKTGGYYSAINSATMALIANMPYDDIMSRVSAILEELPKQESLVPEDHYFIEATRAECFLLQNNIQSAKDSLKKAITFDPLNYSAHASTLKQFRLILRKKEQNDSWLESFLPPKTLHYAGHIWRENTTFDFDLQTHVSDILQQNDIGFGFGSLAAGADIVIAEALIGEGAELNLFLPSSIDRFLEDSVKPFGEDWVSRFKDCLSKSQSCFSLPNTEDGIRRDYQYLVSQIAMGQAVLRSEHLNVSARQLLIQDKDRPGSLTALNHRDWQAAGLERLNINLSQNTRAHETAMTVPGNVDVRVSSSLQESTQKFSSFETAIPTVFGKRLDDGTMIGVHFDFLGALSELEKIMSKDLKGTILVSEAIASFVAIKYRSKFKIIFAGSILSDASQPVRCYTLRKL